MDGSGFVYNCCLASGVCCIVYVLGWIGCVGLWRWSDFVYNPGILGWAKPDRAKQPQSQNLITCAGERERGLRGFMCGACFWVLGGVSGLGEPWGLGITQNFV
jgi:hypothetical protein